MKIPATLLTLLFVSTTLFSQKADSTKKTNSLELFPSIGVGLVRYTITPTFHINLVFKSKDSWQLGINTTSYFFFEQTLKADNTKDYKMYINTFVNTEFLIRGLFDRANSEKKNWSGIGIGYLVGKSGDYFSGTTAKIYYVKKFKHITVMPELIFTNDLQSIFPGVTVRL